MNTEARPAIIPQINAYFNEEILPLGNLYLMIPISPPAMTSGIAAETISIKFMSAPPVCCSIYFITQSYEIFFPCNISRKIFKNNFLTSKL
jgi:hypothetical protein